MGKIITCGCGKTEEVADDVKRTECFAHHVRGVAFNWVGGGGYGRSKWNDATIAEATRDTIGENPSDDIEYVGRASV